MLRESLRDPVFWARYTFAYEEGPGADRLGDLEGLPDDDDDDDDDDADEDGAGSSLDVAFEVGDGHHAVLSMDPSADSYSLLVTTPDSAEAAELGWDDLAHWHPHALRWSELDLICRAIAARDPELRHPGAPLALLCRFAAVFDDDDVDQAVAVVEEAYAALRPPRWEGYWPCGADWLERADFRGVNVIWQRDEAGNLWAHQDDHDDEPFYSTRTGPDTGAPDGFPHAPLRAVLSAAMATVGEGPPGADGRTG